MKCPECGTWTEVLDTRMRKDGSRRRRYQCANLHKFWTEERITPGPSSTRTKKEDVLSTLPHISPLMPRQQKK
jgi:transcriptional regulator NrdR family protein